MNIVIQSHHYPYHRTLPRHAIISTKILVPNTKTSRRWAPRRTIYNAAPKYHSRYLGHAFVAGTGDGIVTVSGKGAKRRIIAYDQVTRRAVSHTYSAPDGRYILRHLKPDGLYLIMARDVTGYNPVAWDNITPSTDWSVQQQQDYYLLIMG